MKLRLGATVLAVALTTLTTAAGSAPADARGTVDTTPPAVGTCHDLTWKEFLAYSEPEAPAPCASSHTSFTVRVTHLDPVANWHDQWPRIVGREYVPCLKDLVDVTGGREAEIQLSSYALTFYRPTKAQRDAGAAWVRCDAALLGGVQALAPVPSDVVIEGTRPSNDVRRCSLGKRQDFARTVCTRRHRYIATWTFKMRGDHYPGEKAAQRFAYRKCLDKLGRGDWLYSWISSRAYWRAGLRYAVCSPAD